jgi:hypothetical protein
MTAVDQVSADIEVLIDLVRADERHRCADRIREHIARGRRDRADISRSGRCRMTAFPSTDELLRRAAAGEGRQPTAAHPMCVCGDPAPEPPAQVPFPAVLYVHTTGPRPWPKTPEWLAWEASLAAVRAHWKRYPTGRLRPADCPMHRPERKTR